jgi:hypothetical protein
MMALSQMLAPLLATFVIGLHDVKRFGLSDAWLWGWGLLAAVLFAGGLLVPVRRGESLAEPLQRTA